MSRRWDTLLREILKFRDARDWEQFHTPKNLAAAIAIEAAELQEHFLWKSDAEIESALLNKIKRQKVIEELADVMIFSLLLARRLDVDVDKVVRRKLVCNARKYPVKKARGNARKYTELMNE
ncbi:MAG: MazG-like family protein [Kiritimatiellae bacterium]|nr:MazG-like family protein [Kiritimatiellia bacterium]